MKKILCLLAVLGLLAQPGAAQEEKVIYLTFDDGPCAYTAQLLQTLEKYGAKATFFVVNTGYDMEHLLGQIVAGGHGIGVHSYSHDFPTVYGSEAAFWTDLRAMQALIYRHTGVETTLMRFPGGSSNTVSRKYCWGIMSRLTKGVEAAGFSYFDWNVDSGDASGCSDEEQLFQNIIAGIRGKDRPVVLQHDVNRCSVRVVERVLVWGQENGYVFRALTADGPTCHHRVQN